MMASLEVRTPFLDIDFAEFANSLPSSFKMRGKIRKYILKKAFKGIVPDEILRRSKKGFGVPLALWFKGPLKPLLLETFAPEKVTAIGLFNPAALQAILDSHFSGRRDMRKQIWALLCFEKWRERYCSSTSIGV